MIGKFNLNIRKVDEMKYSCFENETLLTTSSKIRSAVADVVFS